MNKEEKLKRDEREISLLEICQENNAELAEKIIEVICKYRNHGFNWYEIGYGLFKIVEDCLYDAEMNENVVSR